MYEWIPVYTTDIYIQRQINGTDIRFIVTFIRKNELNGQLIIPEKALSAIIALRNLVVNTMNEEISLDRLMVHL